MPTEVSMKYAMKICSCLEKQHLLPPIHKFPFSENRFCGAQDPSDLNYVHVALVCLMRLQRIYHVFVTTNSRVGTNTRIS